MPAARNCRASTGSDRQVRHEPTLETRLNGKLPTADVIVRLGGGGDHWAVVWTARRRCTVRLHEAYLRWLYRSGRPNWSCCATSRRSWARVSGGA